MKRKKLLILGALSVALVTGGILYAADHIDAPAVTNQPADITDLYVFRGQDVNNLVFVANTQGLLTPGAATSNAKFDANTIIEFNIDTNGDAIEDLVLQASYNGSGTMNIYGPVAPSEKGLRSKLEGNVTASVAVTANGAASPVIGTSSSGIKVFAGPRDDPFFFDLNRYKMIIAGTAAGFANPGTDSFAGTNVLSLVVEVPKAMLGSVTGGKVNVWLETKKKI